MNEKSPRHHLDYLDGIRGTSALTVVVGHSANAAGWGNVFLAELPGTAVDVFMVLSGYLMVYQATQRHAGANMRSFCPSYYLRRFFRIAPLYYLMLATGYLFRNLALKLAQDTLNRLPSLFMTNAVNAFLKTKISVVHVISHLSFLYGLSPALNTSTILPDWTLTLEMQFYVVFPLIFLWFYRKSTFIPTAVLLVVCSISTRLLMPHFGYYASVLPMKLDIFLAGMLLAWSKWEPSSIKLLCVSLAFLCVRSRALDLTVALILICDYGKEAPSVPCLSKIASILRSVFGCALARFMADMSYGIYLAHVLVIIPMLYFLTQSHSFMALTPFFRFIALAVPVTLIATAIAIPLHYGVERPGIAMGRYFSKGFKVRPG